MGLLLAVFGVALSWRVSRRMTALEHIVAALSERLLAAERRAALATPTPLVVTAQPVATAPPTATASPFAKAPSTAATPPPTVERRRPEVTAPIADAAESLESRIGSRWLLYVGVLAIVVGAAYFEKLAIDNHWIGETMRVVQGSIAGLLLVAVTQVVIRRGYRTYGEIVAGCGVAVMYVAAYSAFNFYHLVGYVMAFAWMVAVTALAALLAERHRSQPLAIVAAGGGFFTPLLLTSVESSQAALFGYDALLVTGTLFFVGRRNWPVLAATSYTATVMTIVLWASNYYDPRAYLTTELFISLFLGLFISLSWQIRHSSARGAAVVRRTLWTAPAFYYAASLAILWPHGVAPLVFLLLLTLAGMWLSDRVSPSWRLPSWIAAALPLYFWTADHSLSTAWLMPGVSAWAGVYVLNFVALLHAATRSARPLGVADLLVLHLNGLVAFGGVYLLLDATYPAAAAPGAALLAVAHAAVARMLAPERRDVALHVAVLAAVFLSFAIALQFEGAWAVIGWSLEGAAVAWLGLRERRDWLRHAGVAGMAIGIVRLLGLQFAPVPAGQWALLNERAIAGAIVIGLVYAVSWLHDREGANARRYVEASIGLLIAMLLILSLAMSEILAFWSFRPGTPFQPAAQLIVAVLAVGTAIVWLGVTRATNWLTVVGLALDTFALLALMSAQAVVVPPTYVPFLNGRFVAGLCGVLTCYAVMQLHRRFDPDEANRRNIVAVSTIAASLVTLFTVSSEIEALWQSGAAGDVWHAARTALLAVAWTTAGGALVWRGAVRDEQHNRAVGGLLVAIGIMLLSTTFFAPVPANYLLVLNPRLSASLVVVAMLFGLAHLFKDTSRGNAERIRVLLWMVANAVAVIALTSDIAGHWDAYDLRHPTSDLSSHFARGAMLSASWALYATVAIVIGLRRRHAAIRYFAMGLFAVTIVKVFAIDMAELDQIYRVISIIVLGVMLLLTSYMYQQRRTHEDASPPED